MKLISLIAIAIILIAGTSLSNTITVRGIGEENKGSNTNDKSSSSNSDTSKTKSEQPVNNEITNTPKTETPNPPDVTTGQPPATITPESPPATTTPQPEQQQQQEPLQIKPITGHPDNECLFKPELSKCKSDNGKCPAGFNQNEDGNCFPKHDKCPKGFHGHEDDETGRCISDRIPCQEGYLRDPSFPTCSSKSFLCKEHPEISGCKEGQKPQVCPTGFRLEANGHTCFKIVNHKIIHVPSHSSSNNSNNSSHNLSGKCFDQIKIAWLGKIKRGENNKIDNVIDKCLNIS